MAEEEAPVDDGNKSASVSSPEVGEKKRGINFQFKHCNYQRMAEDKHQQEHPIFMPFFNQGYKLLFASQHFYVFFRLFYTLYERFLTCRNLSEEMTTELLKDKDFSEEEKVKIYKNRLELFHGAVLALMTGTIDANKYDDFIRQWLGSKSYLLLSMDKIFSTTTKSLMYIANEETCSRSFKMHERFQTFMKEEANSEVQWW